MKKKNSFAISEAIDQGNEAGLGVACGHAESKAMATTALVCELGSMAIAAATRRDGAS